MEIRVAKEKKYVNAAYSNQANTCRPLKKTPPTTFDSLMCIVWVLASNSKLERWQTKFDPDYYDEPDLYQLTIKYLKKIFFSWFTC